MSFQVTIVGCHECGSRAENQDAIYPPISALPHKTTPPCTVAVADGMGGARDGQYAAQAAIAQLSDFRPAEVNPACKLSDTTDSFYFPGTRYSYSNCGAHLSHSVEERFVI